MTKQSASKKRKQRGWKWEHIITERIRRCYSWWAERLGSSSTELPDVIAWSNRYSKFLAIECKSGTTDVLIIPREQVERCLRFKERFKKVKDGGGYFETYAVACFKFLRKRRRAGGEYQKRELKEYYKELDIKLSKGERAPDIIINYDGKCYAVQKGKKLPINLPDYKMPFLRK
jgi:hypothetical protein